MGDGGELSDSSGVEVGLVDVVCTGDGVELGVEDAAGFVADDDGAGAEARAAARVGVCDGVSLISCRRG